MSRVGKRPIPIPNGVKIAVREAEVWVEGTKGKLRTPVPKGIRLEHKKGVLLVQRDSEAKVIRALHGLTRTLVANSVVGVTEGFQKQLDVIGIGYRAETQGQRINLNLGFSHPIEFEIPEGIAVKVERLSRQVSNYAVTITVTGTDKCQVGQVAANLRALRPPDPYKGKGVRYADEVVRLKVGKKGA
jgi:large subunit ribosomal protein L6